MRTIEQIKEYLGVNGATPIDNRLINSAIKIEEKYEKELETGDYGYGVLSDFLNNPYILEDEDYVDTLHLIEEIDGVVFYECIYKE